MRNANPQIPQPKGIDRLVARIHCIQSGVGCNLRLIPIFLVLFAVSVMVGVWSPNPLVSKPSGLQTLWSPNPLVAKEGKTIAVNYDIVIIVWGFGVWEPNPYKPLMAN